jgi:hypothetical protein
MTLSTFPRTNTRVPTSTSNRRAPLGGVVSKVGRVFRNAAAGIGEAVVILVAYRAARKRLEAVVEGDLFDDPVLWAEIKSIAWAEARAAVRHRKSRPSLGDRAV